MQKGILLVAINFMALAFAGCTESGHDHHHGEAAFDSGSSDDGSDHLAAGATFSHTFTEEATYLYHCHPHPKMMGTITVMAAPEGYEPVTHHVEIVDDEDSRATDAFGYYRDSVSGTTETTIKVGDTITWTNVGLLSHTVTEGDPTEHHHH